MSADLTIPAETEQAMRDAARDASIAAAKAFGFGGATWTVARWTGDGVTAARTAVTGVSAITGYAYRQEPGPTAPAAPGEPVLADLWRIIIVSGTVQEGDLLTSTTTGEQLTISSVESWYGYVRCNVERQR
jgi:hypothetical protein